MKNGEPLGDLMINFGFVPTQLSEGLTTSTPVGLQNSVMGDSTTLEMLDPLSNYFRVGKRDVSKVLVDLVKQPPTVGAVITYALKNPGIEVQDRAIELLGCLTPYTLQFARNYRDQEFLPRPIFANKTWEIVISALGLADAFYAPHCVAWISSQLGSPNIVKRLAARDALEALTPHVSGTR
ncbi:MAG: hypothetical protein ACYCX6_01335 [Vulcanimicrobiaceae bacterium]